MRRPPGRLRRCGAGLLLALLLRAVAGAAPEPDTVGTVVTLPEQPGPHWFWLSDILLKRTALFDGDSGKLLGTISSGTAGVGFVIAPLFSADHREIYIAETYYSRGVRGERTDVVTVYDARSLQPLAEVGIPPKRAEYFPGNAANALSDDGRFMAVFNLTPMTSLSIVDVRARTFVAEVPAPGCSLVYAAGPRRFMMLCANGAALTVTLDDAGKATVERTEPFFDPQKDPVTEKAARRGNEWFFVSFDGVIHPVNVAGEKLVFGEKWPLVSNDEKLDAWKIGGGQLLAIHGPSGRLYALMHQGPPDSHKQSGTEVWVYDVASKQRVQRLILRNPLLSFLVHQLGLTGGTTEWLLERTLPNPGIERILVTQDEDPVLVTSASEPPAVIIHDAMTGNVLRDVSEPGLAGSLLFTP